MEKEKLTFREFRKRMFEYNPTPGLKGPIYGVVVFTEGSFSQQYSLESRSYRVSSDNKAFRAGNYSVSLFGSALDGSDDHVKLSEYMCDLNGGEDGWKVDYCYFLPDDRDELPKLYEGAKCYLNRIHEMAGRRLDEKEKRKNEAFF